MSGNGNGETLWPLTREEWEDHMATLQNISDRVEISYKTVETLKSYLSHLEKLDGIADSITAVKDKLIDVATGRDQIPLEVWKVLAAQDGKDKTANFKVYGTLCVGLLATIVFLLVGEHLGWVHKLFGP